MSDQSVIVWDLETVPDLKAAARMYGLEESDETKARDALGSGFPKHPLHRIPCIASPASERWWPNGKMMDGACRLSAPRISKNGPSPN